MQFLKHLNPAFDQRRAVLLARAKIPTLDDAIATMMQEECHMKLLSDATGLPGVRSALATSNPSLFGSYDKTHKCYNCGEVGHLKSACPKPPREREAGGRGQPGGRGYDHGVRRGGKGGSSGGYKANLTVAEEEEQTCSTYSTDEQELLEMWRMKLASDDSKKAPAEGAFTPSSRGNIVTYAHSEQVLVHMHLHPYLPQEHQNG